MVFFCCRTLVCLFLNVDETKCGHIYQLFFMLYVFEAIKSYCCVSFFENPRVTHVGGWGSTVPPTMTLPPIFFHVFTNPLPYVPTLRLQNTIHALQLASRRLTPNAHSDYLLLLEHKPVYTAGRRLSQAQTTPGQENESKRLTALGADFVHTARGGQMTYHGPGQLVGYPLLDLGRTQPPIPVRDYVCFLQRTLKSLLLRHGIKSDPGELMKDETGVFVDGGNVKLASIGVQVRHRLTTHGVAVNVTKEPLQWFENIVACGLVGVKAGCIEERIMDVLSPTPSVETEAHAFAKLFGQNFGRQMQPLIDVTGDEATDEVRKVKEMIEEIEMLSEKEQDEEEPGLLAWSVMDSIAESLELYP